MITFTKLMIVAAVAIPTAIYAIGLISRIVIERRSMLNERLYVFHLKRTIGTITSTHSIEIGTDDPFRTSASILRIYPGWGIVGWESPTDREYDEMFGEWEDLR